MDLEKPYDRVDWLALWDILKIYGVGGKLISVIKSDKSVGMNKEVFRRVGDVWIKFLQ